MNKNINSVEKFIYGLANKDTSDMPLSEDVILISPLTPNKIYKGKKEMLEFLTKRAFPKLPITGSEIEKHMPVGTNIVITLWTLLLENNIKVPIFDYLEVENGLITKVRPYFDPRPILSFLE